MAGAGHRGDGGRAVPRGFLARALAVAAAARPRHRARAVLPADGRGLRAVPDAAHAEPKRGAAAAGPQYRPAAPAGHRDRRRARGRQQRFAVRGALARPYRAHAARRKDAEGRAADAAARLPRSVRAARSRAVPRARKLFCRRRRPHEAHRRGLRLARRDAAGQFPPRRLGEPAALYRQAARHPAGTATRRTGPAERRRHVGARRQHAGGARQRPGAARRGHHRRGQRGRNDRGTGRHRQRHRRAPLRHQRRRRRDRARHRGQRRDLDIHRDPGPAADHRARQGSGGRRAAARCS